MEDWRSWARLFVMLRRVAWRRDPSRRQRAKKADPDWAINKLTFFLDEEKQREARYNCPQIQFFGSCNLLKTWWPGTELNRRCAAFSRLRSLGLTTF